MRYKTCAIDFQHQNVVDHTNVIALDELNLTLMANHIYRKADTATFDHIALLSEKPNKERVAGKVSSRLRMYIARDTLTGARIVPLPLFSKAAQFGVTLGGSLVHGRV